MIKKLCTYLVTGSILASTVLTPLQTYAADFEPETKIEYESTEELLNEEEKEVDNTEALDNEEIIEDIVVPENDESEITPDDFSEEKVEVIDFSDEEEIVEEEILDIDEEITEEDTTETELVEAELTVDIDGYTVTATGNMPENAELTVSIIENTEDLENQVNETLPEFEKFTVYKAFDIDILVDGEKWQPVDFDELVSIYIRNIDVSAIKEEVFTDEVVYNSVTEEIEELNVDTVNDTVFRVEDEEITELSSTTNVDEVVFETEHFTTFVYGGTSYDTTSATTTYTAGDNITAYWFSDKGLLAFVGTGDMYDWGYDHSTHKYTIPWYSIRSNITNVYFSDGITTIGEGAFWDCTNLKTINALPNTVTTIGIDAFYDCHKLALTELPSGLTTIGDNAFLCCENLALTELPSGLTSIGFGAFNSCYKLALTELPSGLTSIGGFAFNSCKNLALTELPSGLTSISAGVFQSCAKLALTELPSGLTTIGDSAFNGCKNLALTELPSGLTSISGNAFAGCKNLALTELPSGLTSIGNYAFNGCKNLALTELPSGLTSIGNYAFQSCEKLALTELPSGLTSISGNAFAGCTNLALTELPSGLTSIGSSAFDGCTNLALTGDIPINVSNIGTSTFKGVDPEKTHFDKNLSSVTITKDMRIPTSYTVTDTFTDGKKADVVTTKYGFVGNTTSEVGTASTYEGYALKTDCTDATITIGSTDADRLTLTRVYKAKVFTYNGKDYYDADATATYTAGDNITAYWYETDGVLGFVGTGDMYGWEYDTTPWDSVKTSITDVYFSDGITTIGDAVFNGCENLALTELPSSLTEISVQAFTHCTNLALTGSLPSGLTTIGNAAFSNCYNLALTGELPSGLTTIGNAAFADCRNLALTGELPSGLTEIGSSAFSGCRSLALTGELPSGLTSINSAAFSNCYNLALTGSLPSGLTSISSYAFNGCKNLALTGSLPAGLTSIGTNAFADCRNLALTGELPSGLTTIGYYAFNNCTSLALTGELPSGLTSIGNSAFSNCTNLALSGALPSGLTTIGKYTFYGCTNLALTGELPSGLTSIGEYAFNNVDPSKTHFNKNLSSVTITKDMRIPTSYTVTDTFTDGKKADVMTTKYGVVGYTTKETGNASTYEGYTLKTDCTDATITIGSADADRLSLTREFQRNYQPVNAEIYVSTTINDNPVGDMYSEFMFSFLTTDYSDNAGGFTDMDEEDGLCDFCGKDGENCTCPDGLCDSCGMPENKCCCTCVWQHFMPDPDGTLMFVTKEISADDIGKKYRYIVVEDIPVDSEKMQGMTYDTTEFLVEVDVTVENDVIVPVCKYTNRNTGEEVDSIVFNNIYENPNKFITSYKGKDYYRADATNEWSLQKGFTAYWFEDDGFLYFDGTGEMPAFGIESRPWHGLSVTDVKFNDDITYIGSQFVHGFTTLTDVVLPSSLKEIGDGAFAGCTNLENITELNEGLEVIGWHSFQNCKNLQLAQELPSTLKKIGWSAFINSGVAFSGELPSGLEDIGFLAFEGCKNLNLSGDIPASVTNIGGGAFNGCLNSCFERNLSDYNITSLHTVPTRFTVVDLDDADGKELGRKDYVGYVGYEYKASVSDTEYEHYTLADAKDKGNLVIDKVGTHTVLYRYWTTDTYTIKFKDYDGELISSKTYTEGDTIKVPSDPTRSGYEFDGWSPEVSKTADADATYKATYTKKEPLVTPETIKPDVSPITPTPTTPVTPTPEVKEETKPKTPVEEEVEEDKDDEPEEIKVIIPDKSDNEPPKTVEVPKKTYKITFVDDNGNVISSKFYKEGEAVSIPDAPEKENFEFTNWSPAFSTKAVADAEYKPIYKEVKKEEPVAPAPEEPVEKPKTPIQKAVPAIVAGVVTTGILATGYFSGLWLFLANLLFVKRRKKWHGLLNLEENSFVKNILDESEDDVYIEDVWAKCNGNVDDFVEKMKSLKTATLLPVGTRMFVYLGDGVEVVEYKEADEKKFFDALKDNLDAFGKVTLELRHDKFSVDIEVTFEAPVK